MKPDRKRISGVAGRDGRISESRVRQRLRCRPVPDCCDYGEDCGRTGKPQNARTGKSDSTALLREHPLSPSFSSNFAFAMLFDDLAEHLFG